MLSELPMKKKWKHVKSHEIPWNPLKSLEILRNLLKSKKQSYVPFMICGKAVNSTSWACKISLNPWIQEGKIPGFPGTHQHHLLIWDTIKEHSTPEPKLSSLCSLTHLWSKSKSTWNPVKSLEILWNPLKSREHNLMFFLQGRRVLQKSGGSRAKNSLKLTPQNWKITFYCIFTW